MREDPQRLPGEGSRRSDGEQELVRGAENAFALATER
jgi:hypothetical protein